MEQHAPTIVTPMFAFVRDYTKEETVKSRKVSHHHNDNDNVGNTKKNKESKMIQNYKNYIRGISRYQVDEEMKFEILWRRILLKAGPRPTTAQS